MEREKIKNAKEKRKGKEKISARISPYIKRKDKEKRKKEKGVKESKKVGSFFVK